MSQTVRVITGVLLTGGLLGFGLLVSGKSARAKSLLRPGGDLPAVAGSREFVNTRQATLGGDRTLIRTYRAPHRSPRSVLDEYVELARRQSGPERPYLLETNPDGGQVLWVTEDDERMGVIVRKDPHGGATYQLMESGPLRPRRQRSLPPAGLETPEGAQMFVSNAEDDGNGAALYHAEGSVSGVAGRFVTTLREQGFRLESQASLLIADDAEQLTLPFQGNDQAGVLVVAPAGDGQARVTVSVHPRPHDASK